jgi:hypothetical protein
LLADSAGSLLRRNGRRISLAVGRVRLDPFCELRRWWTGTKECVVIRVHTTARTWFRPASVSAQWDPLADQDLGPAVQWLSRSQS